MFLCISRRVDGSTGTKDCCCIFEASNANTVSVNSGELHYRTAHSRKYVKWNPSEIDKNPQDCSPQQTGPNILDYQADISQPRNYQHELGKCVDYYRGRAATKANLKLFQLMSSNDKTLSLQSVFCMVWQQRGRKAR